MLLILLMYFIILIILLLFMINILISKKIKMMRLKSSSFECGFEMFESIRLPFSIHFFLISILFLIFDVEIIYLFPMIFSLTLINYLMWFMCSLMILMILLLGLEFEKNEGFLKWFI